jgi:hypothetical protein
MRTVVAGLMLMLVAHGLRAQDAVATRAVNVRSGQSTSSQILGHLDKDEHVTLLSPRATQGYYHVHAQGGTEGWVYKTFLQVASEPAPAPTAAGMPSSPSHSRGTGAGSPLGGAATDAILSSWDRPAPVAKSFDSCGPSGKGGDGVTNLRKNRVDLPTVYHHVGFDTLARLEYPINHLGSRVAEPPTQPNPWTAADLAVLAKYEGVAISLTGFIVTDNGVIVEDAAHSPTGESTNCHATDDVHVDWHVTLVHHQKDANQKDAKSLGIVVETTPRVRALAGHGWTPDMLSSAATKGDSVRVSGWLMYDPEHFSMMPHYDPSKTYKDAQVRATLWEVHPITKIEVFDGSTKQWRSLP